jgi:hypothetical protein
MKPPKDRPLVQSSFATMDFDAEYEYWDIIFDRSRYDTVVSKNTTVHHHSDASTTPTPSQPSSGHTNILIKIGPLKHHHDSPSNPDLIHIKKRIYIRYLLKLMILVYFVLSNFAIFIISLLDSTIAIIPSHVILLFTLCFNMLSIIVIYIGIPFFVSIYLYSGIKGKHADPILSGILNTIADCSLL